MSKVGIFMADGCEEIEGLTVVDVLRRAGIEIDMISVFNKEEVTGSHGIVFKADVLADEADFSSYDGIVLPGGMPGTNHLREDDRVNSVIKAYASEGKLVSAICAAPSVLGLAGLLEGKNACSYPGFEDKLLGANTSLNPVEVAGNIITSRGMGTAIDFSLAIVEYFQSKEAADSLAKGIIYR